MALSNLMEKVHAKAYSPTLFVDHEDHPLEFYSFPLSTEYTHAKTYSTLSELLEFYYYEQSSKSVVSQKTADIKKMILTFIDRGVRKKAIQEKAIEESQDAEIYKIYGELLTAYSFAVPEGADSFITQNYYSENYEDITIPLDPKCNAIENAQKYFKHYNKAKRTLSAAHEQLLSIEEDLAIYNPS